MQICRDVLQIKMKLLFVTTGIGYGDPTRIHEIILEIKKKYPKTKILIACYDNSYNYFRDKFPTVRIKGYNLPGKSLKLNFPLMVIKNIFLPATWITNILKIRLINRKFIPDIVISDIEPLGPSIARVLKKKCLLFFGYDPDMYKEYKKHHKINYRIKVWTHYFKRLYNQADLAIIPVLHKRKKARLRLSYINPIIRLLPEELHDKKILMKELKLKRKPIVVMLGGSKVGCELAEEVNKVAKYFKEDFIIFGSHLEDIEFAKNVTYHRYNPEFLKYLKVSKGLITLAGQNTLAEGMIYKKAVLCFPIKDHIEQILNAYTLQDYIMVSKSTKGMRRTLNKFIKEIPKLQKKTSQYKLKPNGAKQFLKLLEIALQE